LRQLQLRHDTAHGNVENRTNYRYYSCSAAARMGKTACKGRSIPMNKLDQLVTSHIADYLLVSDRVADLLAEILNRRAMAGGEVRAGSINYPGRRAPPRISSGASTRLLKTGSPISTKF
jgi:hypothetical protein